MHVTAKNILEDLGLIDDAVLDEAQDPADVAIEFLRQGEQHAVFKKIDDIRTEMGMALVAARKQQAGIEKHGGGGAEAATVVKKVFLPKLDKMARTAAVMVNQMKNRLR